MIRQLISSDISIYIEHSIRVYETKGLMSIDDDDWVKNAKDKVLNIKYIEELFNNNYIIFWGFFDQSGQLVKSIRSDLNLFLPKVTFVNYKSELIKPFNPIKDLLPILNESMSYYEKLGIYTFHLVRRTGFFEFRKNKFFEDYAPLNRYNCYFDEVIPPNTPSNYSGYNRMMGGNIYPVETGIVCMSLKQELRYYGDKRIIPDTREMYESVNKPGVCIIGHNPNAKKISNSLINNLQNRTILTIERNKIDFENNIELLFQQIDVIIGEKVIILNLYDHTPGKGYLQGKIFDQIFEHYRNNKLVHIVALGSLAYYYETLDYIPNEYMESKKLLKMKTWRIGLREQFICKLSLIELGTIECFLTNNPPWKTAYFTDDEIAKKIIKLIEINDHFMSVSLNGKHIYTPKAINE